MPTPQEEFEEVALPHLRSLLRVARRLSSHSGAAEDAVQETYLLAWRSFHRFERGSNARAWLFRILLNAIYAQSRKNRRSLEVASLAETEFETAGPDASVQSESALLLAAEVSRALGHLSLEHRTVLLLAVVEGFTCQEIAGILSIPIGTVMSRLSRARQTLRALLTAAPPEGALYARREIS